MTVLMLGRQLELGYYRAEFLKSHGIRVIFPETDDEAISVMQSGHFDAVIVSYTLEEQTAKEFVKLVKQVSPDCPVVAITRQRLGDPKCVRDETVLDTDKPQALLQALIRIEKRRFGVRS